MAQPPEDESFFSRWSKRKRVSNTVSEGREAEQPAPDASEAEVESPSDDVLADLPSLDMFTIETDIRPFLQKGVPHAMRNAALRKKWLLTPSIRDHADPAVDYAWDWNTPGGVPGDGFAPNAQKAAEMLRDLTGPRRNAACEDSHKDDAKSKAGTPPEPATDAPASAVQQAPSEAGERAQNITSDPVRLNHDGDRNTEENQSDIIDIPLRRRHGSALPD